MTMSSNSSNCGVIIRIDARQCEIEIGNQIVPAAMRGKLFEEKSIDKIPFAVGDYVHIEHEAENYVITGVAPRRNLFARNASGESHRRQLLGANLDQIVHVASFGTPPFSSLTADCILAAANSAKIPVALVINKLDLDENNLAEKIKKTYEEISTKIIFTSAKKKKGLKQLESLLSNKQSLLYGLSGAGKSTLLNSINKNLSLKTNEVSNTLHAGKHTTTFAKMYKLPCQGNVIDTPGVRSFKPYGIEASELRLYFPEMAVRGRQCKFSSCLHQNEPNCKVKVAAENGTIAASRWRSYLSMLKDLQGPPKTHSGQSLKF